MTKLKLTSKIIHDRCNSIGLRPWGSDEELRDRLLLWTNIDAVYDNMYGEEELNERCGASDDEEVKTILLSAFQEVGIVDIILSYEDDIQLFFDMRKEKEVRLVRHGSWRRICRLTRLPEKFMRYWSTELDWPSVCANQFISADFVSEFEEDIDWASLSMNPNLASRTIQKFSERINIDLLNWMGISRWNIMSMDFLIKFEDKIFWNEFSYHNTASLTPEIMIRFKDRIIEEDLAWDIISAWNLCYAPDVCSDFLDLYLPRIVFPTFFTHNAEHLPLAEARKIERLAPHAKGAMSNVWCSRVDFLKIFENSINWALFSRTNASNPNVVPHVLMHFKDKLSLDAFDWVYLSRVAALKPDNLTFFVECFADFIDIEIYDALHRGKIMRNGLLKALSGVREAPCINCL